METIQSEVGKKIRFFRKLRGMTLDELATAINKSKSSLSKYEKGTIIIDIVTLSEIASALDISPASLIDTNLQNHKMQTIPGTSFFEKNKLFEYHFDGRRNSIVKSVMNIRHSDTDVTDIKAQLFVGVSDYKSPDKCRHYYSGCMMYYDMLTHFILSNETNPVEKMHITIINPLGQRTVTSGMMMAFSEKPFANLAAKIIVSEHIINENDDIFKQLIVSKEEIEQLKKTNLFLVESDITSDD
jgi:transcriptional regulator with XRE-family HTH domain